MHGYIKISKKNCNGHEYGQYSQLDDAKQACNKDSNCSSVFDLGCGEMNKFHLCSDTADSLNETSLNDCIYYKTITSTKQLFCKLSCEKITFLVIIQNFIVIEISI